MRNKRAPITHFVRSVKLDGAKASIRFEDCTRQFILFVGSEVAAECADPVPLVNLALDEGAIDVRHDYDPTQVLEDY